MKPSGSVTHDDGTPLLEADPGRGLLPTKFPVCPVTRITAWLAAWSSTMTKYDESLVWASLWDLWGLDLRDLIKNSKASGSFHGGLVSKARLASSYVHQKNIIQSTSTGKKEYKECETRHTKSRHRLSYTYLQCPGTAALSGSHV